MLPEARRSKSSHRKTKHFIRLLLELLLVYGLLGLFYYLAVMEMSK